MVIVSRFSFGLFYMTIFGQVPPFFVRSFLFATLACFLQPAFNAIPGFRASPPPLLPEVRQADPNVSTLSTEPLPGFWRTQFFLLRSDLHDAVLVGRLSVEH